MPFNNCRKCGSLFHFLEPTSLTETEEHWPSDVDQVCVPCRTGRVTETDSEASTLEVATDETVAQQASEEPEP